MNPQKSENKSVSSRDLLSCGEHRGIHDKLLLKCKKETSLRTEMIPRSHVFDRLQSFLPQMAQANETLKQQMENSPADQFNIESVEEAEKVIEMDVAVVELEGSDSSDAEDSSEDESSDEETASAETLKLPGNRKRKANIVVLETDK